MEFDPESLTMLAEGHNFHSKKLCRIERRFQNVLTCLNLTPKLKVTPTDNTVHTGESSLYNVIDVSNEPIESVKDIVQAIEITYEQLIDESQMSELKSSLISNNFDKKKSRPLED
ncbi:hypothetical protein Fot_07947 [Forsythia ovata]|uniref:Uncharacterized protein n=1 Tax=Forsythia ovata TaxID=205694 RepID=A0ABD1X092_9LAMI